MAEVIEKEVNPQEDVANDVRAAINALKGDEAPAAEAAVEDQPESPDTEQPDAEQPKVERARAPDGKFVAKDKTEEAPAQAAAPDPKSPPAEAAKPSTEQPSTAVGAAPVSWAADVKAQWASLPPAVQQAVIKREQEVSAGFRQYSEQTKRLESYIAPIAQEANRFGLSVDQGIQRLLDGQRFLEQQPAQAIVWLANKHGLNLAELAQNPPAVHQPAQPDPQFAQVIQYVQSLEERLNSRDMDQNMTVVEKFAHDHPFYAQVEDQLPDIMRALQAANPTLKGSQLLQEAYDFAVYRNPDIRAQVMQQQQADAQKAAAAAAQQKAQQATRAAVSVKGASVASIAPKRQDEAVGDDPRDAVRAAINQLRAG